MNNELDSIASVFICATGLTTTVFELFALMGTISDDMVPDGMVADDSVSGNILPNDIVASCISSSNLSGICV